MQNAFYGCSNRPIVFPVEVSSCVQADDFATVVDVPQPVTLDQRRRADALHRPVVHAAGSQFGIGVLPEKFAVGFPKTDQTSQILPGWKPFQETCAVVCTDEYTATGNNGRAIGLTAQTSVPFDVLAARELTGLSVLLAHIPSCDNSHSMK